MADKTQIITGSGYSNADLDALEQKIQQANAALQGFNTSKSTDEELRGRAENEYRPIYNAAVSEQEAAKKSAQTVLDSTLGALERQYRRDQESLNRAYDTQLVNANNSMLARGFNNSSLATAMLNHSNIQRNRALENLAAERAAGESNAQAIYNNAISAADAAIGRLGSDLALNVDARYQALRDAEQNRLFQQMQAQNQLAQSTMEWEFQLAQLRQQAYNQYLSQQSSGGASGGGGSYGSQNTGTTATTTIPSSLADLYNKGSQSSNRASSAVNSAVKQAAGALSGEIGNIISGINSAVNGGAGSVASRVANAIKKAGGTTGSGNSSKSSVAGGVLVNKYLNR